MVGREYWRRTAEGFYRLEHLDLEDMFGRRPRPSLELKVKVVSQHSTTQINWLLVFQVRNIGRAVARFPTFRASLPAGLELHKSSGLDFSNDRGTGGTVSWSDNNMVIHISPVYQTVGTVQVSGVAQDTSVDLSCELFADRMCRKP
jgi:hypothetical protein